MGKKRGGKKNKGNKETEQEGHSSQSQPGGSQEQVRGFQAGGGEDVPRQSPVSLPEGPSRRGWERPQSQPQLTDRSMPEQISPSDMQRSAWGRSHNIAKQHYGQQSPKNQPDQVKPMDPNISSVSRGQGSRQTSPEEYAKKRPHGEKIKQIPKHPIVQPSTSKSSQKQCIDEIKKLKFSDSGKDNGKNIEIANKISGGGTLGKKIQLEANHFELKLGRIKKAYHYDFLVEPDTPKKMMRDVFNKVEQIFFEDFHVAFDGRKIIFSPKELPFENSELRTIVKIPDEGNREKEFKVRVKKVNEINLDEVTNYIDGVRYGQIHRIPMNAIQVLDVVLRPRQSCFKINVGSSLFSVPEEERIKLGGGMDMYRGSYQSVQLGWKPFLNIDVSNKAFPSAINIIDLINELNPRELDINRPLRDYQIQALNEHLKTLKVKYTLPNNPSASRSYLVNEVDDTANNIKFRRSPDSPEITVVEYYLQDKRYKIKYPNMPCLWVGSKTSQIKVRVPAELCKLAPGQAVKRKLDSRQTTEMIKKCATSTDVRKRDIQKAVMNADFMDPVVKAFDLQVDTNFAKLTGRVLEPPNLGYQNKKLVHVSKGVWKADKFLKAVNISDWTILCLDDRMYPQYLEKLENEIIRCGRDLGMNIAAPRRFTKKKLSFGIKGLYDLKTFFQDSKEKYQIIFVVILDYNFQYNYVKEASEILVGCLTQCIKSSTVQKRLTSATVTNILLKVNAKLTGTNHCLLDPPEVLKTETKTMIMGADVTHPSPDSRGIPSIAAVTASHDPEAFQYNICWRLQPPRQEILVDLGEITKEQIMFYKKKNQREPDRIIFFRDGVSNGQFLQVLRSELTAILAACSAIKAGYKPKVTFIVVQKRHNTRLFPVNPKDSEDKNNNVPAGTCVDTEITDAIVQNFFLVSHASIQGVARPTKYVTLWDDSGFTDDELESLTYYLCHLFARCTRSVSYPAPTYYAHLAAARIKAYFEPHNINIDRLQDEQNKRTIKYEIVKELPMFYV